METELNEAQLLEIAKRYWRTDEDYYLRQEVSPESARLSALWKQELKKLDRWRAFLVRFGRDLPPGFDTWDVTSGSGATPCFRGVIYFPDDPAAPLTRWRVVGCVSILAPIYVVYGASNLKVQPEDWRQRRFPEVFFTSLPEPLRPIAEQLGEAIERKFGVQRLPWEVALTPVPLFAEFKKPPHTLLLHTLFDTDPTNIP